MAEITVTAADGGQFGAYLATPAGAGGPALVVIQEIFGVNAVMRALCDGFAAAGYLAVCPDLFWRQDPGIQLTDKTQAEWDRAFALMQGFDTDLGIADLKATLAQVRALPGANGKAGIIGYCLGGKLAYLMATRSNADCSVAYYGVGLDALVGEAASITKPLLMHVAEADKFVSKEAQATIKAALAGHPQVSLHSYAGVNHAFAREGGEHYDAAAAGAADERTAGFLATHLRG